jgi:drug/metabolite transporter (DMT)-like permease
VINPLRLRFLLAAAAIFLGGVAIMLVQKGVGDHPVLKGAVVCLLGMVLAVTGLRQKAPTTEVEPRPRLFQPDDPDSAE